MQRVYIYNDSFESLISLILILLSKKVKPDNIKNSEYAPNLFEEKIILVVNEKLANDFLEKLDRKNLSIIYYAFLSEKSDCELVIYYYILNYLKYGTKTYFFRNLKCVNKVLAYSTYVSGENHKFKGFTRFEEKENKVLYAVINPTSNILGLLSLHFQKRLRNELWMIKDVGRNIISVYDKKHFYIISKNSLKISIGALSIQEQKMQDLWKEFYNVIAIKERKNLKCRQNFMPKKYWKNICEVKDEL